MKQNAIKLTDFNTHEKLQRYFVIKVNKNIQYFHSEKYISISLFIFKT